MTPDLTGVYICDLGIAKICTEVQTMRTSAGAGTPAYMAPEMYQATLRGPPADIYSFGCLLIELFTREWIWKGLTSIQIMHKVLGSFNNPPIGPDIRRM